MYSPAGYRLAPHTAMRTEASALVYNRGITPRLIILGGSNFGVRYDDEAIFGPNHPTQKTANFSFEAFAASDYGRKAESEVIKGFLVDEFGVPADKVLAEPLSSTTQENAQFLEIMLRRRPMFTGSEKIGILTLLYHMEKALPVFRSVIGLDVEPVFAEDVLAQECHDQADRICEYYSTPKGGKQYDTERLRQLLTEGKSVGELMGL